VRSASSKSGQGGGRGARAPARRQIAASVAADGARAASAPGASAPVAAAPAADAAADASASAASARGAAAGGSGAAPAAAGAAAGGAAARSSASWVPESSTASASAGDARQPWCSTWRGAGAAGERRRAVSRGENGCCAGPGNDPAHEAAAPPPPARAPRQRPQPLRRAHLERANAGLTALGAAAAAAATDASEHPLPQRG
jgi:hypothetical protein